MISVAAGYMVLLVYVWLNQASMLYLPHIPGGSQQTTPADYGMTYQEISLLTEDQVKLHAWFVPAPEARGVVLFCHGNAGSIAHRISTIALLNELGWSTLIFDYRGYGQSDGRPDEQGTYLDAEAAWMYLIAQGYQPEQIIVMGRSLGGAVAAQLAQRQKPRALVLESTFTSVPDIAAELYPFLPVRSLSRFQYATNERLPGIGVPLLIVHSREDEIIPFHHGEQLYQLADQPKRFLEMKGGHNNYVQVSGVDYYRQQLGLFFDSVAPQQEQ